MSSLGRPILALPSPKRAPRGELWDGLFPYYAGFSEKFAVETLRQLCSSNNQVIWDPFNGSGTTTFAARSLGLQSVGSDINPVMAIAARARTFPRTELSSLRPIAAEVARNALGIVARPNDNDPLRAWFSSDEVCTARSILEAIVDVTAECTSPFHDGAGKIQWSCLTSILVTCLFSTLRKELAFSRGSNPTWVPRKIDRPQDRTIKRDALVKRFEDCVSHAHDFLFLYSQDDDSVVANILLESSEEIGPLNPKPNFVLTSPPYLTRIDYTVKTRVELALLHGLCGYSEQDLRTRMMGSTVSPKSKIDREDSWGKYCIEILQKIFEHKSKASPTYYYKTFIDYFDKLFKSLNNISRNLDSKSKFLIVVQDSRYKEIHVDLQRIVRDMMEGLDFSCTIQEDFSSKNSMAYANPKSSYRVYGKAPIESVILFERVC